MKCLEMICKCLLVAVFVVGLYVAQHAMYVIYFSAGARAGYGLCAEPTLKSGTYVPIGDAEQVLEDITSGHRD